MTEARADKVRRLAEEHWAWIEDILADRQRETAHMFIEGFIHGFKHGAQEQRKGGNDGKSKAKGAS